MPTSRGAMGTHLPLMRVVLSGDHLPVAPESSSYSTALVQCYFLISALPATVYHNHINSTQALLLFVLILLLNIEMSHYSFQPTSEFYYSIFFSPPTTTETKSRVNATHCRQIQSCKNTILPLLF